MNNPDQMRCECGGRRREDDGKVMLCDDCQRLIPVGEALAHGRYWKLKEAVEDMRKSYSAEINIITPLDVTTDLETILKGEINA